MLRKIILSNLLLYIGLLNIAQAESSDFGIGQSLNMSSDRVFIEIPMELPEIPNLDSNSWLDLYINETYRGHPRILLDSIEISPDNSIHYVLNHRSASGYNNITAEGIRCVDGLLNSDGMLQKTFAYADLSNNQWIRAQNPQWKILGGKRNASDPVRRILYEIVCANHKIFTTTQLKQLLIKEAGKHQYYKK